MEEEKIKVKVGGKEMEVDLEELKNGYMRQADYTRKTQELAEERKRLEEEKRELQEAREVWEFLKANPEIVERIITEAEGGNPESEREDVRFDEYLEHIARLETEIEELRFRTAHPDADIEEVMRYAVDHQIPKLEIAYKALQFEKMQGQTETETQEQEETGEKTEQEEEGINPLEASSYAEILSKVQDKIFE